MFKRKYFAYILVLILAAWGAGRIYYVVTDGFTEGNIAYDLPYEVRRDVIQLPQEQQAKVRAILGQKFHYLGKGCQSYVFESADGAYVLKFFKFQRYRPQALLDYFAWIPFVDDYRTDRLRHKQQKLDKLFTAWKVAFEDLPEETGLLYVKLSRNGNLEQRLAFTDKMGLEHEVDLDRLQFLVQYKADMLCPTLDAMFAAGDREGARQLINRLIDLFLSEYERGYADFDPAIMQNTGVLHGRPIHVDVGQITRTDEIYNPEVWKQDLFNKTYKFRGWLRKRDAVLADELDARLESTIGPQFHTMKKSN